MITQTPGAYDPKQIGSYRVMEHISDGASAAVFRGEHEDDPSQVVAIKITKSIWNESDIETRVRFEQEADLLSRLSHPHIVRLIKFGVHENRLYLVMELAEGIPLSRYIAEYSIPDWHTAAEILRQAALLWPTPTARESSTGTSNPPT